MYSLSVKYVMSIQKLGTGPYGVSLCAGTMSNNNTSTTTTNNSNNAPINVTPSGGEAGHRVGI